MLGYDDLISKLSCTSDSEVEDLIFDAIYQGLLAAKLDQQRRIVNIDYVVARDINSSDLPQIRDSLLA
ncbi:hypothetical protein EV182_006845, partial [Spiromyces aspiralis]